MYNSNKITISVIIPTYQDKAGLTDTVNSLLSQDFPKKQFEIIIVDNNSKDDTKQIALEFQNKYPDQITVVHQDQIQSSYATRNTGIKVARGEICCFIDTDMTTEHDYLSRIYKHFQEHDIDYLGCKLKTTGTPCSLAGRYNHLFSFPMENYFENRHWVGTGCLSVKKDVFSRVGLFDERLESGGDQEFGHRVYQSGLKQFFDNQIILYHPPRSTLSALFKKEKRKTRGKIQLASLYPARYAHYIQNLLRIRYYTPMSLARIKAQATTKKINLTLTESFFLSYLHSFLRIAGLLEFVKHQLFLKNKFYKYSLNSQSRKLRIYFISDKSNLTNHRTKLIFSLRKYYQEMILVSPDNGTACGGFNLAINPWPNPLGILSRIGLKRLKQTLDSFIFFPSPRIIYIKSVQRRLEQIIAQDLKLGYQVVIFNSLPPHDLGLIGLSLKERFPEIKWIMDWRDLWGYDQKYTFGTPKIYERKRALLEKKMLSTCDMNVTTNHFARKILIDHHSIPSDKVISINHAFCKEDLDIVIQRPVHLKSEKGRSCVTIGFLGNLHKPPKVPTERILTAIQTVKNSGVHVQFHIYGDNNPATHKIVQKSFSDVAVLHPRLPHVESLGAIADSDFLLLSLADNPNCKVIMHAKLAHYLILCKPVIAMVPDDSFTAKIVKETNCGFIIPCNKDWGKELTDLLKKYSSGELKLERNQEAIEKYSWENISQEWIKCINSLCEYRSFT